MMCAVGIGGNTSVDGLDSCTVLILSTGEKLKLQWTIDATKRQGIANDRYVDQIRLTDHANFLCDAGRVLREL